MASLVAPSSAESSTAPALLPKPYRIERVRRETKDVFRWLLVPESQPALHFRPGQFVMVYAFGVGEVPISVSSDPADPQGLGLTIRASGSVTGAFAGLGRGTVVGLRGPFGRPWPIEAAEGHDLILVAGGIGLAPLRPVICTVLRNRARFRRVVLLYGARSPRDLIFRSDWRRWERSLEALVTVDHVGEGGSKAPPTRARGRVRPPRTAWRGHVGVVTTLFPLVAWGTHRAVAFVCGPEVMMRHTVRELLARGVAAENIFLSLERNMKCAVGWCGHCQLGPSFICKDGPVFPYPAIAPWLFVPEL